MAKSARTRSDSDEINQKLEKLFGVGTIVKASENHLEDVNEWVSTGSITLDRATGGKGIPKDGKCTAILGRESASKTTLALHIIANEQLKGNLCCFLDVECTLDTKYAEKLGVNLELLHIVDRESLLKSLGVKKEEREVVSGEEWLQLTASVLQSNIYGVVVLDSVAALIPQEEITSGLTGGRMSRVAAMMSRGYRTINAALSTSKSAFIYLNQYRMNPGGYGNPYIEPGGEAWKYLQVLKIEITKSLDKDTDGAYGIFVKGKITKSKVCPPYKEFQYYVKFGEGIQREHEIYDLAVEQKVIQKGGAWFTLPDLEDKIQGEEAVLQYLKDNKEYTQELLKKIA